MLVQSPIALDDHSAPQPAYGPIDEPDLSSPLEIAALPERRLDLSALFG